MTKPDAYDPDKRPLPLVTEFNQENAKGQFGYQMIDDLTVLERKRLPVNVYNNSGAEPWAVLITVYDFNSLQALTYVQQAYDSNARTPQVFRTHFSEIEGRQAIADAHRALTLLGGSPPPLETVMDATGMAKPKISRRPRPPGGGQA